jgi:hypothetical protein
VKIFFCAPDDPTPQHAEKKRKKALAPHRILLDIGEPFPYNAFSDVTSSSTLFALFLKHPQYEVAR